MMYFLPRQSKIHYSLRKNTGFTLFDHQILLLMMMNKVHSVFACGDLLDVRL